MSLLYGVIGHSLSHSFSPAYFKEKFAKENIDASYRAFEIASINYLPEILKNYPLLKGLNVTIPYKQAVIDHLDALSNEAAEIGAVNCINIRDGILKGYNTDIIGFQNSLTPLLKSHHDRAIILGNGGASLAVQFVLNKLNIPFILVSRRKSSEARNYEDVNNEIINTHKLIINTTPLGMYPHIDEYPLMGYEALTDRHLLYDLIYNPQETQFLAKGRINGASTKNGFEMLELQAEASWEIWNQPTV